jgi:hypothetical protein
VQHHQEHRSAEESFHEGNGRQPIHSGSVASTLRGSMRQSF